MALTWGNRSRELGLAAMAAGAVVIILSHAIGPAAARPLYDGVVPVEPYRWLSPPAGQAGSPTTATATVPVSGGQSPLVAVATQEQPPQAQLFAAPSTLTLPAGTTSIQVSITPVQPTTPVSDGQISGNVYRIRVTNQASVPITAPASGRVSVVLRAADATLADASIELLGPVGTWHRVQSEHAGFAGSYVTVVTGFGDFAVVAAGSAASGSPAASASSSAPLASPSPTASGGPGPGANTGTGIDPLIVAMGAVVLVLAIGAWIVRGRARRAQRPLPKRRPERAAVRPKRSSRRPRGGR